MVYRERQVRNIYLSTGFDRLQYLDDVNDEQLTRLRTLAATVPPPDTSVMVQSLFGRFEPDDCQNWVFTVLLQAEEQEILRPGVSSILRQLPRY